jgi:hypothetical protein
MWCASVVSGAPPSFLDRSAIPRSRVEMFVKLGVSSSYPSLGSMFPAPPSLQRVPSGRFPAFIGTMERSDSSLSVPAGSLCSPTGTNARALLFAPLRRVPWLAAGWPGPGLRRASAVVSLERRTPPRFLGCPRGVPWSRPAVEQPGGTPRPGRYGRAVLPSATRKASAPTSKPFEAQSHGPLTRCLRFTTTVARRRARLASGRWPAFAGQDRPAGLRARFLGLLTFLLAQASPGALRT